MRRLAFAACLLTALAAITLCGCSHSVPSRKSVPLPAKAQPQTMFVCHHKLPAEAGECIRQELEHNGLTPTAPKIGAFGLAFHQQCLDISRYQGLPDFHLLRAEGIVCVIIQGADNTSESNPYFNQQVRSAHEAGLKVGVYIYTEGGPSSSQADALGRVAAREGSLITLGYWIDTEQTDAYEHACGIAARLRSVWHARIVGDYGSPGNVPSWMNQCGLLDWPAEWGGGAVYPAPGFSYASVKFRQWCVCHVNGVGEVDRDEDLGLLALAQPVHIETASQKRKRETAELHGHEKLRALLHGDIERHKCRLDKNGHGHEVPHTHHQWEVCRAWIAHGQTEIRLIQTLTRRLA